MVEDERRVQHEDLDHRLQNLAMQLFLKSSTYCTAVLKRVRSNLSNGYACSVADCSVAVKASREGLQTVLRCRANASAKSFPSINLNQFFGPEERTENGQDDA